MRKEELHTENVKNIINEDGEVGEAMYGATRSLGFIDQQEERRILRAVPFSTELPKELDRRPRFLMRL